MYELVKALCFQELHRGTSSPKRAARSQSSKQLSGRLDNPPLQLGEPAAAVHLPTGQALQPGTGLAAVPASDVVPWRQAVQLARPSPPGQIVTTNINKESTRFFSKGATRARHESSWHMRPLLERTVAGGRPLGWRRLVGWAGLASGLGGGPGACDRNLADGAGAAGRVARVARPAYRHCEGSGRCAARRDVGACRRACCLGVCPHSPHQHTCPRQLWQGHIARCLPACAPT